MNIVVSGASGFLGRALLKKLSSYGTSYIGLSRQQVPGLFNVKNYSEAPVGDVLVHLAEINDRAYANRLGPVYEQEAGELLQNLVSKGYKKIIYTSSAILYGDSETSPRKVSDPVFVVDSYTRIKRKSEEAVLAKGGIVARLSNLYGPGMSEANVLSTMLRQLSLDGPLRLHDTSPVRDFLWIEDAAEALLKMIQSKFEGVFNVGTGVGTSIAELANEVLVAAGQPNREVISAISGAKHSSLILDILDTKAALNWQPKVLPKQGIRNLVNAYI